MNLMSKKSIGAGNAKKEVITQCYFYKTYYTYLRLSVRSCVHVCVCVCDHRLIKILHPLSSAGDVSADGVVASPEYA